jgi:ACS family glucarate transporter-like MFS transporter
MTTQSFPSPQSPTRIRWLLIGWLFILSAVAFLDRVNLSVAGTRLAADYHLSDVQFGLLSTVFLLGYALLQTPAGWLADRFGPRRVLAGGVIWWGIFTALTALVPTSLRNPLLLLLLARVLLGAGEAVMYPCANQFVAHWIPTQERGLANGLIFAGVGVGSAASPPLITYIMIHYGWRFSFWICAILGLAAGLIWFLASRDTPDGHPMVSASELTLIRGGLAPTSKQSTGDAAIASAQTRESRTVPWGKILKHREVWLITLSYFCYGYVAWIFFAWFFIYLARVRGMNLKSSAFYGTLPFVAMALGCALGGLVADFLTRRMSRRTGRCGVAALGLALSGAFLAFGSMVDSAPLASVILAGGAGALYISQSSFWAISADIGGPFSGSVSGFMNMGGQLGGALTASLTPFIAVHFGWTTSFLVAAALALLSSAAWLVVDPDRPLALVTSQGLRPASLHAGAHRCGDRAPLAGDSGAAPGGRALARGKDSSFKALGQGRRRRNKKRYVGRVTSRYIRPISRC